MQPKSKDVLYILGNGFDLSHGIESSYWDFEQWVKLQNNKRLIELMDTFFSTKRELWSDIETALGEYEEDSILDYCRPEEEIDYDHMMRSVAAVEDSPDYYFRPILDEFIECFNNWVNSIDISDAKQNYQLHNDSMYLTFNYTETLEYVYKISSSQIKHIHGSRVGNDDNYIIGHNNLKKENNYDNLDGELDFEQDTKNKIIGWMNKLYKNTNSIINNNRSFFNSLGNIKTVMVIGHSLYDVDWAYFDEVSRKVCKDAQWIFHYHTREDLTRINNYISHSIITNHRIVDSNKSTYNSLEILPKSLFAKICNLFGFDQL